MILSLLKVLLFFAVVLALALGVERLAETGEPLRLVFGGVEYTLGPVQVVVAIILLLVAAWLFWKILGFIVAFLRFLMGDQTALHRWFDRTRERRGYAALGEGMLAVAAGESQKAQDKAARAAKLLKQPYLTDLLAAQAAELADDPNAAGAAYRRMLADERTRFVGIRGLMQQRLDMGDTETALKLAEKAYALKPRNIAHQDQLLSLHARAHDWKGARGVLKDKRRQGQLPKDVHTRRDAVLAVQEARDVLAKGESVSARDAAISANRAAPELVPAAVLAAQSFIARKDRRNASKAIERTWKLSPHPALAAVYAEIVPDETPQQRLRRFETLTREAPDNPETRMLKAELLLAAEDFPGARRALGNLAETDPTVRSLSIMAAIERGEGSDDSIVRGWLTRAMTASRGPQWVCGKCDHVMADWAPVCDNCGAFDTLSWRKPDRQMKVASVSGVEMLPLIVGAPQPTPPAPVVLERAGDAGAPADVTVAAETDPQTAEVGATAPSTPSDSASAEADNAAKEEQVAREVADVPPGIVPREADFIMMAPSHTVTEPDEAAAPPPRPDVEPPQNGSSAESKSRPEGQENAAPQEAATQQADSGTEAEVGEAEETASPPVRPDVEPLEDEVPGKRGSKG